MKRLLVLLMLCASQVVLASPGGWMTADGKSVSTVESMKRLDEFGALLLITPDEDWQAKWNTSSDAIPDFNETAVVEYGERLTVLTFFVNPKVDKSGKIDVTCDVKVTGPDGSVSADSQEMDCGSGELDGDPRSVRLAPAVIEYVGERGDPPGLWKVNVRLTDRNREETILLTAQFELNE